MTNLNVSYAQMNDEAAALTAGKEEITGQLQALQSRISNLISSGFVTDSASGAFHASYENFTQSATSVVSNLDNMAGMLRQIASTLQETDQALAQQMRG